jgi:hypothetical protein
MDLVSMWMIFPNWRWPQLSSFVDERYGVCLHVNDAGAAVGLEAVLIAVGTLAEAVLGDEDDEAMTISLAL